MIEAKVVGIPDLKRELAALVPKLRVRALRNALAAGARLVQRAAKQQTPVISAAALAVRRGYRKPGTVRDAIRVRTSKVASRKGDVGVFVNVKPAKGARYVNTKFLGIKLRRRKTESQRGAKSPNDPFYWRFLEFGTARGVRAFGFLQRGAGALPQALAAFTRVIGEQIAKLNRPKAPPP